MYWSVSEIVSIQTWIASRQLNFFYKTVNDSNECWEFSLRNCYLFILYGIIISEMEHYEKTF